MAKRYYVEVQPDGDRKVWSPGLDLDVVSPRMVKAHEMLLGRPASRLQTGWYDETGTAIGTASEIVSREV